MLRILKSLLAESSYFFEKYFGATSIAWSVIFVAFCSAVIIGSTVKGLFWVIGIKKNKKKTETAKVNLFFPVYIGIMLLITYFINYLVNTAYTWNSKLQRVMSNFEYVLSFKTNRHAFLFALNLPDNVQNKKSLFKMALYLNDKQWDSVFNNAGEGAWYFEKVKKAIFEILHVGDCHLMLSPLQQGWLAYFPIAGMLIVLLIFLLKRNWANALVSAVACISGLFVNMGASIFMLSAMCFGVIWAIALDTAMKQSIYEGRKPPADKMSSAGQRFRS